MADPKHILITGASGFLGTWLANAAHERGLGVIGVDIVPPSRSEIFSAFATESCERVDFTSLMAGRSLNSVFHLAGSASVPQSVDDPVGDFASLLPGTISLLAYLGREQKDAHLLFFSSAAVYGNPDRLPIGESTRLAPISPYGIHKAAAEFIIEQYARVFGLRSSILRLFSAYGEGLRKQILWDLCQKALAAEKGAQPAILLHGTGQESRDFIHAADIAKAALLIAEHPPATGTQVINVASGTGTSIRDLAESVLGALKLKMDLQFTGVTRAGDPVNWCADVGKLRELGFTSSLSLAEGIGRVVAWQRESGSV